MVGDPIGDMLVRIKNAGNAGNTTARIPFSKVKYAIAELLKKQGYLADLEKKGKTVSKEIEVKIAYDENEVPKIKGLERVSKPSRRVYFGVKDIKPVRSGYGLLVISTPKGILTGSQAKKELVGGEVLFKIW